MLRKTTTICREGWYYLFVLSFIVTGAILREINLLVVLTGYWLPIRKSMPLELITSMALAAGAMLNAWK